MPSTADETIKRVYIEKRPGFDVEAAGLKAELAEFLGDRHPELAALAAVRILHRYDVARLDEARFDQAIRLVFSEPQCDQVHRGAAVPAQSRDRVFAVEYLGGQYDQRADSAEQCVELAVGLRPTVRTARVYILSGGAGPLSEAALAAVKDYLINPVDSREASLELPSSLESEDFEIPAVPTLQGFRSADDAALRRMGSEYGLAMSAADLAFCRAFFAAEGRDPTLAELRVLDTYWSDHCRHSTFTTVLERIEIADGGEAPALRRALERYEDARREVYGEAAASRPRTLMDLATIGAKAVARRGLAADLEVSKEINACSVRVDARFADGRKEKWLLMFKNETHNHPTEIEPFGGAATCLGGAIRDPLSGRAYVHQAMRVSGGGDPRAPLSATLPGKLPQVKIAREAAAGYASYGNQIGLATGQVAEFYHPGFLAKRMELGAVIAAAPEATVRQDEPAQGDTVLLVGGKTGRDGIGGATGSSKAHTDVSVGSAGAEVQKGNAVEERKLQRLFRNPEVTRLIKRCNDFGAGGVSVAVGELSRGLDIDLDQVPKKYAGLDGVELAISESQERMAVVVAPEDAEAFVRLAAAENLTAVPIAVVTCGDDEGPGGDSARLRMTWRGQTIVDLPRSFLDTNGAPRSAAARIAGLEAAATADAAPAPSARGASALGAAPSAEGAGKTARGASAPGAALSAPVLLDELERSLRSLRSGSRRGLQERFDGSIGAGSVLFPWGGAEQGTPECGMAALLPSLEGDCRTAGLMSFGYDPELAARSPYEGAKGAIKEALTKFACLGGDPFSARLSLQEYFEKTSSAEAWGKPLAALLGALEAQLELGVPAIGGKDSMSGSYADLSNGIDLAVPPTLVAFAAGATDAEKVRSGALSGAAGNQVVLLTAGPDADEWAALRNNLAVLAALSARGLVKAAYPVGPGGVAETLALMAFGNNAGVEADASSFSLVTPFRRQGSLLAELDGAAFASCAREAEVILEGAAAWAIAARTIAEPVFRIVADDGDLAALREDDAPDLRVSEAPLAMLRRAYEYPLARVYPQTSTGATAAEGASDEDALDLPLYRRSGAPRSAPAVLKGEKPLAVLPAFPGTNCEWDMERAFRRAGARTRILVFRNRSRDEVLESTAELAAAIGEAQILALSGGFSAGDEPEGSGKFIAAALRSPAVADAVGALLGRRDGLVLGICNGFQALIKTGLLPYGEIRDADATMPTLTYNALGRHVSRMVRTKVMSDLSPWLSLESVGAVHTIPVSHGEGRLAIRDDLAAELLASGQVAACYVDVEGRPTMAEPDNPNGSAYAVEGLTSADGRILGKMGHSERTGDYVHVNIPGPKVQRIFEAGVRYFS